MMAILLKFKQNLTFDGLVLKKNFSLRRRSLCSLITIRKSVMIKKTIHTIFNYISQLKKLLSLPALQCSPTSRSEFPPLKSHNANLHSLRNIYKDSREPIAELSWIRLMAMLFFERIDLSWPCITNAKDMKKLSSCCFPTYPTKFSYCKVATYQIKKKKQITCGSNGNYCYDCKWHLCKSVCNPWKIDWEANSQQMKKRKHWNAKKFAKPTHRLEEDHQKLSLWA